MKSGLGLRHFASFQITEQMICVKIQLRKTSRLIFPPIQWTRASHTEPYILSTLQPYLSESSLLGPLYLRSKPFTPSHAACPCHRRYRAYYKRCVATPIGAFINRLERIQTHWTNPNPKAWEMMSVYYQPILSFSHLQRANLWHSSWMIVLIQMSFSV